ncbi:MAG: NAD-dependent succinate-semialdehyde dehydrogenase [Chloroflexota bacterium]|nr:NAD-dependent succinate-semialdehyde dehydrogenase [Chloroflexota bacterium]
MTLTAAQILSIDPATEEVTARFEAFTPEQADAKVGEAHAAFLGWREKSFAERAAPARDLAVLLRERKERYAALMTLEMGKPITQARAEVEKCAWNADFYAQNAERFLGDEPIATNARSSFVRYEPLGVVLAVMPWNYPFWQVIRFAAPALMAGNAAVLKHASNVPRSALALEELFRDAGFPDGLFGTVLLAGGAVEPLIADDRVKAVTLTGSSITGERIAAAAGRHLKKVVLELGGSDPFIVLDDADIDAAAATGVTARTQNNGQSCIAAKRFIVEAGAAAAFEKKLGAAFEALVVGDPKDDRTQVGPLARGDLRETLERQVRESVRMGARVVTGGKRLDRRGYFYEPTLLADVTPEMPVLAEETFGPAAALVRARDADDAVRIANATPYGLGSSLWTRDEALARRLAQRIDAGSVFVNSMVFSDPRLPFGGVKQSGYGRELSAHGIREFTNVKTVWLGPATGPQMPQIEAPAE